MGSRKKAKKPGAPQKSHSRQMAWAVVSSLLLCVVLWRCSPIHQSIDKSGLKKSPQPEFGANPQQDLQIASDSDPAGPQVMASGNDLVEPSLHILDENRFVDGSLKALTGHCGTVEKSVVLAEARFGELNHHIQKSGIARLNDLTSKRAADLPFVSSLSGDSVVLVGVKNSSNLDELFNKLRIQLEDVDEGWKITASGVKPSQLQSIQGVTVIIGQSGLARCLNKIL